jgi:mannose/fructose/N-acetylgalactosamine-specific phosphotransferase system component IID
VKEEFYAVAFRKTFYESLDQLQQDLDRYLEFYNHERAYQTFLDGVEAMHGEEVKPEAA